MWWRAIVLLLGCSNRPVGDGPDDGTGSGGTGGSASTSSGSSGSSSSDGSVSETSAGSTSSGEGSSTSGCAGRPHGCVESDTLACADLAFPAECVDGAWRCVDGLLRPEDCTCYYLDGGPICLMSQNGECSDITVPAVCEGSPGDGGWVCPRGSTPMDECDFGGSTGSTG